jgi:predicted aspartyl protease
MLQSLLLYRPALIFLSTTLAVLAVACHKGKEITAESRQSQPAPTLTNDKVTIPSVTSPTALPSAEPKPSTPLTREVEPNSFESALNKAAGAFTISQSAQSKEDWNLVASLFQEAITLMKEVPESSPYFLSAQSKITEFERQIQNAHQKANLPLIPQPEPEHERIIVAVPQETVAPERALPSTPRTIKQKQPLASNPSSLPSPAPHQKQRQVMVVPFEEQSHSSEVFLAPIKRRVGGTPIIEVTFNGNQRFDMIVDTGASGTVITQDMANSLGVTPVGKAKANTASSKAVEFSIGYVDSIAVDGITIRRVPVAIAGTELEIGLLGHDFFGNYDLTIKRDIVEFRPQLHSRGNSVNTKLAIHSLP